MRMRAFALLVLLALLATTGNAKDEGNAAKVIGDVAKTIGAPNVKSLQYMGTGYTYTFGQSFRPNDAWPKYTLLTYMRLLDYEKGASVDDSSWTQYDASPPLGGGYNPLIGEIHEKAFVNGIYAWSYGGPTRSVDKPAMPSAGALEVRQLQMVLTPHGWVKAAMASSPTLEQTTVDGKQLSVITFRWKDKYKVVGYVNSQNLLERVETWINVDILGDVPVDTTYSEYRDFSGIKFPSKILQTQGGYPMLDLTVTRVQPNAPTNILEVPDAIKTNWRTGPAPPPRVQSTKIADGVWAIMVGSQSVAVEFNDFSAVFDTDGGEARSLAVIAETKRLIPNKPIRYVIVSHHHLDHSGGLRTFVAEGSTIVSQEMNVAFFEQIFKMPHTLVPDKLSQNPRPATWQTFKQKYVMTDGTRTMELHLIQQNTHAADLTVAYLPKEKLLLEADPFNVFPEPESGPVNLVGLRQNLLDNIQRLKLDVQQIVAVHAGAPGAVPVAELLRQIQEVGP